MDTITMTAERVAFLKSLGLGVEHNADGEFLAAGYIVRDGKVDRYGWTEVKPGSGKIADRVTIYLNRDGVWSVCHYRSGTGRQRFMGSNAREAFAFARDWLRNFGPDTSWAREGYRVIPGPRAAAL